jgi:hypothetical protein
VDGLVIEVSVHRFVRITLSAGFEVPLVEAELKVCLFLLGFSSEPSSSPIAYPLLSTYSH